MANMTNLAEALGPWLKASRWYSGGPAAVESAIELAGEWEATVQQVRLGLPAWWPGPHQRHR